MRSFWDSGLAGASARPGWQPYGGPPVPVSNGRLVGGPAPIWTGSTEIVFGRGTDNQLWYSEVSNSSWTSWSPLGGKLTSKPGAVSLGGGAYAVFVRGTDGAVWQRVHSGTGWNSWQHVGGQVLSGTGPTAAYLTGTGHIYVGVPGSSPSAAARPPARR